MARDELYEFDGSSLENLARDLRRASRDFRREVDVTLVEIGTEITAEAKTVASRYSKTVAGTIKMRPLPGMVIISVGSADSPIGAIWELGNKGSKAVSTTFKHPVFGNRSVWVEQARHPVLKIALAADRRQITKRMEATWDRALGPYRLRPTGV